MGDDAFKKNMNWKNPIKEGKALIGWKTSPAMKQRKTLSLYWNYQLLGSPRIMSMSPKIVQWSILKGGRKNWGRISTEARNADKENH